MPHKLLLADDSVTIQRVIELTFADEDVSVTAVGDGKQAIERIGADPPDIVLADVGMPEKDGYQVAEFVKSTPRLAHIPVLLLTGAFEPVDEERAARVGCDGVLAKPFEPQMVITRVRELLTAKLTTTSRPTPQLIQPPPPRPVTRSQAAVQPPAPARLEPPEPLPPPAPPPFSAGPTPVVPLSVAPPPPPPPAEPAPPAAPPTALIAPRPVQAITPNEVEVRLPVPGQRGGPATPVSPAPTAAPEDAAPDVEPDSATRTADLEPSLADVASADVQRAEVSTVESAIDAVIRIRRRPPVAVPEVGVPPKADAPEPAPGQPGQLDDYFDRLDAKFASLGQGRDKGLPVEPTASLAEPVATLPPVVTVPPAETSREDVAAGEPPPGHTELVDADALPQARTSGGLAQAFSALLDAERDEPGSAPGIPLFAPASISPALREELVEQVSRRVLEQLSDRVVRETVTDLVSRVTERLVREEIERLKATVK